MKTSWFLLATVVQVPGYGHPVAQPAAPPIQPPGMYRPVRLPDPGIAGFRFPEAESTILRWVKKNDRAAIAAHAWGLWTALTQWSDQEYQHQRLRVFETWNDTSDLLPPVASVSGEEPNFNKELSVRTPVHFTPPRQLEEQFDLDRMEPFGVHDQKPVVNNQSLKFDPEASEWISQHNLLSRDALKRLLLDQRRPDIPPFRKTAIALKPLFRVISSKTLQEKRYFQINSWPGPPPLVLQSDNLWHGMAYPEGLWNRCIWIDLKQPDKDGSGASDCRTRTENATYGLNQFIHFRLTPDEARLANEEGPKESVIATPDDYAILIAMHVTTKEIAAWTWQTFWWSDQPMDPPAPSARDVAARRPVGAEKSVRHYAQCAAYQEVLSYRPSARQKRVEESVYCYNPYLEAASTPIQHARGITRVDGKLVQTANDVGVQTNCMSCHANANFNPSQITGAPDQTGARRVDLKGAAFKGVLRLDFLWSLFRESR